MNSENRNSVELKRLINLVHVPEINNDFKGLLNSFEGYEIQQHVKDCKTLKFELFKELYLSRMSGHDKYVSIDDLHWFEITSYGEGDWRLTMLYPHYHVMVVSQHEILPFQVIQKIIDVPVNQQEIITADNLESLFWRKSVDVKYCRLTEGFICGTVELNKRLKGEIDVKSIGELAKRDLEMAFRKFHYYIINQPGLLYPFIVDFLKSKIPGLRIKTINVWQDDFPVSPVQLQGAKVLLENFNLPLNKNDDPGDVSLYNLVAAPQSESVGEIMHLRMQQTEKYEFRDEVKDYLSRLDQIRQTLTAKALREIGRSSEDKNAYPPIYWFEISPFSQGDWGITHIDPMPRFMSFYNILPDVIVSALHSIVKETGSTVKFFNHGGDKLIRPAKYWILRLNSNHIVGIVVMDINKIKKEYRLADKPLVTGLSSAYWILDRHLHLNPDALLEYAFRFQEAYSSGSFGSFVFPKSELPLSKLIEYFT